MYFGFDEDAFKKSVASIFGILLVIGFVPVIGLIRAVPLFKEIIIGAGVLILFTNISDTKQAIKFTLITGMIGALLFNIVYIPGSFVLGGIIGGIGSGSAEAAGVSGMLAGLGALANIIGFLFISPIGYTLGGVLGSILNDDGSADADTTSTAD